MLFPLFIALPGEQVIICLKRQKYSGQVTHASTVDTTGDGAKTRYIVKVAGHNLELNENQIQLAGHGSQD